MAQAAKDMSWGRFHMDDRGIRYCDIFPELGKGDVNVSVIEPGAAALWHRHRHQADYQIVVKGSLKVGMCNLPNFGYNASLYRDEEIVITQMLQLIGRNSERIMSCGLGQRMTHKSNGII